jgi:hypothetical protein
LGYDSIKVGYRNITLTFTNLQEPFFDIIRHYKFPLNEELFYVICIDARTTHYISYIRRRQEKIVGKCF